MDEFPFGLDQVDFDIDVPPCGFRIGTNLVRAVHKRLRHLMLQTRQADVETSLEKVTLVAQAKVHLGVNRKVRRQFHLFRG